MKKRLLTILTIFFFSLQSIGQNIIYKGDKQFPATHAWKFECANYSWTGDIEVQIAKTATGGYLRLSIDVPDKIFFIGGPVYVFLTDGSRITCSDKGIKDNIDQQSVALYVFTKEEMDKLQSLDIQKLRFSIKSRPGTSGGPTGSFTANNKKFVRLSLTSSSFPELSEKDYYETSKEVSSLYN